MNLSPPLHDVVIAGAGPVGLFLACELGLAGCSVLVLEQAGREPSPLKRPPFGLRGLSAATVDSLDRRDLLTPLRARMNVDRIDAAAPWLRDARASAGHFAGIDFFYDQIDFARWPYRPRDAAIPMAADLESIEKVLTARALELGVTIRWAAGVSDVTVAPDEVSVRVGEEVVRARWLVGCDGARSVIRKAAGFGFAGTEPEFTGYFLDVVLAEPDLLPAGQHNTEAGTYIYEPPGMLRMVEFDRGAAHRQPVTLAHVQAVLRRISGTEVEVSALGLATTWTDRAYLASQYIRGRALIAGDAAHIHSPLGGQGLNLGIGDAMNLGWKLARVVRGTAGTELLETYELERRPVAEQILDWSRAQVALMRPDRGSQALRSIVGDLIATHDGATYLADRVWGTALCYDLGDNHPLVGRSVPNVALEDGRRVNELHRNGRSLLVDFDASDALRAVGDHWRADVFYVRCNVRALGNTSAALVRPDGFVAWQSTQASDSTGAHAALSQWSSTQPHINYGRADLQ